MCFLFLFWQWHQHACLTLFQVTFTKKQLSTSFDYDKMFIYHGNDDAKLFQSEPKHSSPASGGKVYLSCVAMLNICLLCLKQESSLCSNN